MTDSTQTVAPPHGDTNQPPETWIDPEEVGVPWVNPEIQQRIAWRDRDIVISVPLKTGTTWTMNISCGPAGIRTSRTSI